MTIQRALQTIFLRPAVPLLFSLTSGILLCSFFPGVKYLAALLSFCAGSLLLICIYMKKDPKVPVLLFFVCLGYLIMHPHVSPRLPLNHIIHFSDSGRATVSGDISGTPVQKGFRRTFYLNVETVVKRGTRHAAAGKLRVTTRGELPPVYQGDTVTITGRIRPIRNFSNPGGFDYKRYMSFKGVHATVYAKASSIRVTKRKTTHCVSDYIAMFRGRISGLIESSIRKEHKHVLKALLTGEKENIPKALREAFNRAGAAHLLAISGLHIGIVSSLSFFLFRGMFSRIRCFLWNAWAEKSAAVLSCIPVLFYGILSGMSPSTQRAVIMVTVFLLTFLFEKRQDMLNTIAVAAFAILFVSPASLYSVSFQLSFAAVFFIVYASSNLVKQNGKDESLRLRIVRKTVLFFFISLFAIAGTLPLVAFYFNQISFAGLITNFLFIPIIGFVIVPLGLMSILLFPIHMPAAGFGISICGVLLEKTIVLIKFISSVPFSAFKVVSPSHFEIVCIYLLLIVSIHSAKEPAVFLRRNKSRVCALTLLFALGIDAGYWLHKRFFNTELTITILDVGQGSAALVEFPGRHRMLIDGGGFSDNTVFDVGERILAPFLWRNKIRTINTLVLSHPNCDHLNGLIYIAEHFHVDTVLSTNETSESNAYQLFLDTIIANDIHMPAFEDIQKSLMINGVTMDILYPPDRFTDKKETSFRQDSNNNSLVVRLKLGTVSFLFPGDIMKDAEHELVSLSGDELQSTLLVAPHHGSRTSSTEPFLRAVAPEAVIISSGWNNWYNMPHPEVLERYNKLGFQIFRTDRHGAISIRTDGNELEVVPTIRWKQ